MLYKKLISMVIVVLLSFSIISACDSGASDKIEIVVEEEPIYQDFDGYEFVIQARKHGTYNGMDDTPLAPAQEGIDDRLDKVLKRYRDTETNFNVTIRTEVYDSSWDNITPMVTAASVGEKFGDIVDQIARLICKNRDTYFMAVEDIDPDGVLDLKSGRWGMEGFLNAVRFNGLTYGIQASDWAIPPVSAKGYFIFNHSLIANANAASPYELEEKGIWNWEEFEKICTAVTDTSSADKTEHVYGFTTLSSIMMLQSAIMSNGAHWVSQDPTTGRYMFNMEDPKVLEALDWFRSLLVDKKIGQFINEWSTPALDNFVNLKTAFISEHVFTMFGNFFELRIGDEGYSWTHFPTGPKGNPDKDWGIIINDESRYIGIARTPDEDYDITLALVDYIFSPLDGETSTSWQENFKRYRFYNEESFNQYYIGLQKGITDYSTVSYDAIMGSTSVCTILQQISAGKSAIETIQKFGEKIQANLDKDSGFTAGE